MAKHFCPVCGTQITTPRPYCTHCGAVLPPPVPLQEKYRRWLIIGGVLLLLIATCTGLRTLHASYAWLSQYFAPTQESEPTSSMPTSRPEPAVAATSGVFVHDDFTDHQQSVLTAAEDETAKTTFVMGVYDFTVKTPQTLAWAVTDRTYGDLAIEADTTISPDVDVVAAGLIFHYQDKRNFYLFSVANDGYYALELLHNDTWLTLIDWTESEMIKPTSNTLRVETMGDQIALNVNGSLLEVTRDDTLMGGDAGLAVSSFDSSPVTIRFDNLFITRSP